MTRKRLQRGVFHSIIALQTAIKSYIEEHNREPKPFRWTKTADQIMEKIERINVPSV